MIGEGGTGEVYLAQDTRLDRNAFAGKREEAQKKLDELLQMSRQRFVPPTQIAIVYAALGEKDKAFDCLTTARRNTTFT